MTCKPVGALHRDSMRAPSLGSPQEKGRLGEMSVGELGV